MSYTDMTPEEIRAAKIAGLRAMADWLDANPDAPVTYSNQVDGWFSLDEVRTIRKAAPGGWAKEDTGSSWAYIQDFTPGLPDFHQVRYILYVSKSETCQQVQTGVKHVEAVEAHDEPVYEWQCAPAAGDGDDGE